MTPSNTEEDNISPDTQVKQVSEIVGEWGPWHTNITLFCTTVAMFSSFNSMTSNFYQPATDFRCTDIEFVSMQATVRTETCSMHQLQVIQAEMNQLVMRMLRVEVIFSFPVQG